MQVFPRFTVRLDHFVQLFPGGSSLGVEFGHFLGPARLGRGTAFLGLRSEMPDASPPQLWIGGGVTDSRRNRRTAGSCAAGSTRRFATPVLTGRERADADEPGQVGRRFLPALASRERVGG